MSTRLIIIIFISLVLTPASISSYQNNKHLALYYHSNDIAPTNISIDNTSILDEAIKFLRESQDDGKQTIDIMDHAFYKAMIIYDIWAIDSTIMVNSLTSLLTEIYDFINSCKNPDGGYANWPNGISSLESTYQALMIYSSFDSLDLLELSDTLHFIQRLQTSEFGFYPLVDWDAPDITSTYRAIKLLQDLGHNNWINSSITNYIQGNYIPPFLLYNPSGYAEIKGGNPDLIATNYALQSYEILNYTETNIDKVTQFVLLYNTSNGGFKGSSDGITTLGYSATGLDLYLTLSSAKYNKSSSFHPDFLINLMNFALSNKSPGSGFTSSSRDSTPSLSSTYFAMRIISKLISHGLPAPYIDLIDIASYILVNNDISYGIGNYPGDIADLSYTTRALLLTKTLGYSLKFTSGISNFIEKSFDRQQSAFGYRPYAEATIKYTYYGIRALRALNYSLDNAQDLKKYILLAQNSDGFFGKKPDYQLGYITYTYWALQSLKLLNELDNDEVDADLILKTLLFYRNRDTGYANYPGSNSSIISTYRGLKIRQLLGDEVNSSDPFIYKLHYFKHSSGGYLDRYDKTVPSMEATYYAIQIAQMLDLPYNSTEIQSFVMSLRNPDGGFATRPGYSSRVSSTYQAILLLLQLENNQVVIDEDIVDIYSPLIYPSFNARMDTNSSFSGTYSTGAIIADPESSVRESWIEVNIDGKIIKFKGNRMDDEYWKYTIGPFNEGTVEFRIVAADDSSNISKTEWFYLQSVGTDENFEHTEVDFSSIFFYLLSGVFLVYTLYTGYNKEKRGGELLMHIETYKSENENYNLFLLALLMISLAILANIIIDDALLIITASYYLFKYLFAVLMILFLRYVVGMKSYGYFAPAIIAVSWATMGLGWGLLIFANLFLLSSIVRRLIQPYAFPVGFRIAIMMLFLVTSITVLEMIGEIFKIEFLAGSLLIPILITPWMADRYIREGEETNYSHAFLTYLSTMFITFCAYLVMIVDPVILFFSLHPELWILLLFLFIIVAKNQYYTVFDKKRFKRLFTHKVSPLTMIGRNRDYISRYNQNVLFPFINKFYLKEQFDKWKVPTTNLLAVIEDQENLDSLINRLREEKIFEDGFVVKPSESYGGKGIIVISKRTEKGFIISGQEYHPDAVKEHVSKIIQGEFLSSQTSNTHDIAIIEERVIQHPDLSQISLGLADIRVIVFKGIPVMAMSRLATEESDGKANLKQGALGAAIDMKDGSITRVEYKQNEILIHPDTKKAFENLKIDNWNELLAVACLAQKSTGLGYAGVDLVIDENNRILVLEVNKRPGLEIQNINLSSLLFRLQYIEKNNLDATEYSPIRAALMGIELADKWRDEE
ncbi:MAG: hypothetical protein INQ03_14610 [Candidatus Heimdallarchaeota archaeon]|nr:hypothetical protein [Candidatus Heimdallarchaeota archaeon]